MCVCVCVLYTYTVSRVTLTDKITPVSGRALIG